MDIYERLLAINSEAFANGQFEVAVHGVNWGNARLRKR